MGRKVRVCPNCKSRATKIVNLSLGKIYCQRCKVFYRPSKDTKKGAQNGDM